MAMVISVLGDVCAFDYSRHEWVRGLAAVRELAAQLAEERDLVAGPTGPDYLRFLVDGRGVPAVLADIDARLAELAGL